MIMCVLLCYPVSIHMSQVQATGRPISSFFLFSYFQLPSLLLPETGNVDYLKKPLEIGILSKFWTLLGIAGTMFANFSIIARWLIANQ